MGRTTAVAVIDFRDEVIARVAQGEYLSTIAADLGRSVSAISHALAADPDYKVARESGLEAKLAKRELELEQADKEGAFVADRLLSHARWRAERECPQRWGKGPDVVINTGPTISEALGSDALSLLDQLRTVSTQRQGATLGATHTPDGDS